MTAAHIRRGLRRLGTGLYYWYRNLRRGGCCPPRHKWLWQNTTTYRSSVDLKRQGAHFCSHKCARSAADRFTLGECTRQVEKRKGKSMKDTERDSTVDAAPCRTSSEARNPHPNSARRSWLQLNAARKIRYHWFPSCTLMVNTMTLHTIQKSELCALLVTSNFCIFRTVCITLSWKGVSK